MKKLTLLFIIVLCATVGASGQFSKKGTKEKKFISNFLLGMDHEKGPKYEEMMKCISRVYIQTHNIEKDSFKVDNYTIWGFSIENYSPDGKVQAKIWGEDRSWVHRLTFKLVKEGGKLYLSPSSHSDSYIDPWWERETYIKEVNR